jgi:hypothetical protein
MKRLHLFIGVVAAVLVLCSCKPALKVTSEYDKTVDFTRFKTFAFFNTETLTKALSQLNHERVLNAVKNEMTKRGFSESSSTPDLMVNVSAIYTNTAAIAGNNYYEYGSVYRPYTWGPGIAYTNYDVRRYKDGSLIIDVVEPQAKKLLWQGVGMKETDVPAKHPESEIPKAVASIMAGFPPTTQNKKNESK